MAYVLRKTSSSCGSWMLCSCTHLKCAKALKGCRQQPKVDFWSLKPRALPYGIVLRASCMCADA